MSSVQEDSVGDDDATPSNSQTVPETTVALSTNGTLGEPINQVVFGFRQFDDDKLHFHRNGRHRCSCP